MPRPDHARDAGRSAEELAYARWLAACTTIGFLLLTGSFVLYIAGAFPPHIPVSELPRVWSLPAERFLAATGMPSGWGWLTLVARGDILNFVGIAFVSLTPLICCLRVLPMFALRRDRAHAAIAAVQVLVLALAASGLLTGPH